MVLLCGFKVVWDDGLLVVLFVSMLGIGVVFSGKCLLLKMLIGLFNFWLLVELCGFGLE